VNPLWEDRLGILVLDQLSVRSIDSKSLRTLVLKERGAVISYILLIFLFFFNKIIKSLVVLFFPDREYMLYTLLLKWLLLQRYMCFSNRIFIKKMSILMSVNSPSD
jgi:hypothetical protein